MPGGRRTAKSGSFKHHAHASDDRHSCEMPTHPQVIPPKHIPIPDLPPSSDLYFEIDSFLFCLLAMGGQYINLYRSVFWLPYSHTEYALNYYLINYYVLIVNLIMVGRRLPVCFLKQICFFCIPASYQSTCAFCIRILTLVMFLPIVMLCFYYIIIDYGPFSILPLIYPIGIYLIAFGPTVLNFLELKSITPERNSNSKSKGSSGGKNTPSIGHVCSMSAETIRDEVEVLKNDFNERLKQVIFNTIIVTYHAAFLPCYFAQASVFSDKYNNRDIIIRKELYYEVNWVTLHGAFTGLSCFTLYASHCFPPRYCDILHRAALHLGRWQRVEIKNVHVPYSIWSESTMWNQGALVKHSKELFKAEGISNAAEPGHNTHSNFYALFQNPSTPVKGLWIIQLLLLLSQMAVMFQSYAWNDLISVQLLILVNCKTLFGITKVFFVVRKIYYEEKLLISKFNN